MSTGNLISKILNIMGGVILVAVIICCVPFTLPKFVGCEIYSIDSGSMAPDYPDGSVVYVKPCESSDVAVGDVITYRLGTSTDKVMTHRVVSVDNALGTWTTKGDSSEVEDAEPISFDRLVGKPVFCIKKIGLLLDLRHSAAGLAIIVGVFGTAALLFLLADRVRRGGASVLLVIGLALVLISAVMLAYIFSGYKTEDVTNQQIRDLYGNASDTGSIQMDDAPEVKSWAAESLRPDFNGLSAVNSEVIAWIRFDGETYIDYPVLYSGDDDKYLHTDIYGDESKSGCIFLEGGNNPDMTDYHSIIYGHNMKNLSMFGSLKRYKTEDYYEDNQYFTVFTETAAYRYRIFAYYDVDETDDVYTIGFAPGDTYSEFIEEMLRRSYYDTGVAVTENDRILTLSTCSTTGKRFVVHSVLADNQAY